MKWVQEILFITNVVVFIRLKVMQSMILNLDSKALIDMLNNWNVEGHIIRHLRYGFFLSGLKEQNVILLERFPGVNNPSDMFTKNVAGPKLKKHIVKNIRESKYGQCN